MKKVLGTALCVFTSLFFLSACGGGGGGSGFNGAGRVSLIVEPDNIDVGDRLRVTIQISDVNDDGILAMLRFPEGLVYVDGTGILSVDGTNTPIDPDVNAVDDSGDAFLVFFLTEDDFDDGNGRGEIELEFEGDEPIRDGMIEVDIDVDDPNVSNDVEFDIEDPQFQQEDGSSVEVVD